MIDATHCSISGLVVLTVGSCAKIVACGGKRLVQANQGVLPSGLNAVTQFN